MSLKRYKNGAWQEAVEVNKVNGSIVESANAVKVYENGAWVDKWISEIVIDKGSRTDYMSDARWLPSLSYPDENSIRTQSNIRMQVGQSVKVSTIDFYAEGNFVNPDLEIYLAPAVYGTSDIDDRIMIGRKYIIADSNTYSSSMNAVNPNSSYYDNPNYYEVKYRRQLTGTFSKIGFRIEVQTSTTQYNLTYDFIMKYFSLNGERLKITARP